MFVLLLGAPGSGKGTQGKILAQRLGLPKITTGDILRTAVERKTDLGREAKKYMDSGKLVPDAVVLDPPKFVLTRELTEFRVGTDIRCRLGTPSHCAESNYPVTTIADLNPDEQGVLPLLVETPGGIAAVCESDVRDWAAMFLVKNASGDGVAVTGGIAPSEHVVVTGASLLTDGEAVRVIP